MRRAATYYDSNEVRVVLSFGQQWSGTLHLYAVDWDSYGRRESITVNGQSVSLMNDFSQGAWLAFPISVAAGGTVTITADRVTGPNAVLSGIFLGDTGAPFAGDVSQSPQGSWVSQVGSQGYVLGGWTGSGDVVSLPSAVSQMGVAQGSRYVWAQST